MPAADRKRFAADYSDLLTEKRLLINDTYIENDDVVGYFSQFEIGICFYDFNVDWINHFNYRSAPSGKLFKYLAAGIPVLASDISGFLFVNEFECGVLIANLGADQMQEAIEKIRGNYAEYCTNAIKAAKYFSFDKAVKPYLDFVKKS